VSSAHLSSCYLEAAFVPLDQSLVDETHAGGGLLPRDLVRQLLALRRDASAMASSWAMSPVYERSVGSGVV
jgi:hypothetical protein